MDEKRLDDYLTEIKRYHQLIERVPEEDKVTRINLLSKQLVFIGRLASYFAEQNKRVYATRKRVYSETYLDATKHKAHVAELAVVDLREEEAEAYGNFKRWSNAFESTREEINALKYKVKIDFADGSSN